MWLRTAWHAIQVQKAGFIKTSELSYLLNRKFLYVATLNYSLF